MAIKVSELIDKLREKDQDAVVEFIVCKTDGEIICVDIKKQAKSLASFLSMFGSDK